MQITPRPLRCVMTVAAVLWLVAGSIWCRCTAASCSNQLHAADEKLLFHSRQGRVQSTVHTGACLMRCIQVLNSVSYVKFNLFVLSISC